MVAATAATKKLESELNDLRRTASMDLAHVGETADDVSHDLDQVAASSVVAGRRLDDVGDEALGSAVKLGALGHELDSVDRKMGSLAKTGTQAGEGLLSSIGGLGSNLRGAMIPVAIGALAALAPMIGGMVAGAVVGTVGLGGIAGGIAMASKDSGVRAAASEFGEAVSAEFFAGGKTFVKPIIESLGTLRNAFTDLHLAEAFAPLAAVLPALAEGIAGFATSAMPGLSRAFEAAVPAIEILADTLPDIGEAFGDMFAEIAESEGALTGLRTLLLLVEGGLMGLGKTIDFLASVWDDFLQRLGKITGVLEDISVGSFWATINDGLEGLTASGPALEGAWAPIPGRFDATADATRRAGDASTAIANSAGRSAEQAAALSQSFDQAAAAAGGLKAAFDDLNGPAINFAQAEINVQEALHNMKVALEASNGSLNVHTEKGRAARQAVLNFAEASATAMQAKIDETKSVDDAIGKYHEYRSDLIRTLTQAGLTKKEARELADAWLRMPKDVKTKVSAPGAVTAKGAVDALMASINNLHGKTIYVKAVLSSTGSLSAGGNLQRVPGLAGGTPSAPRGLSWVGEEGPELISLGGGERIWSHRQSMAMATTARHYAGGTGGSAMFGAGNVVTVNLAGATTPMERAVEQILRRATWNLGGGSAQVAVGRS